LIITKGAAAPEVERVYTRAQALCQQLGETPYHFWVMLRLWNSSANRVQPQTPREHAEQLLPLPQKGRDLTTRLPNFLTRGMTSFFLGELVPAREQLEQGIVLYVPRPHRSAFYEIACLAHVAQALWY